MKKILLLNPPGKDYFIRDYYCSHISKGKYYWPPLDLLVLSGILKSHFRLYVLDALIQRMDYIGVHNFIKKTMPDFIICVTGAVSWNKDMTFLSEIKKINGVSIILSGDYPLAQPKKVIENYPFVDAIILDFTDCEIIKFIQGGQQATLKNIATKFDKNIPAVTMDKTFSISMPQHSLFPLKLYHLPHIYYHPFATIMTDFGCPFQCTFCPYERIGYKVRNIDNVVEELEYILSLGIKELWLRDQSFGALRNHALEFCKVLKSFNKRFSWSCEMRVDAADEELLAIMRQCGCHTLMFGVETAEEEVLNMHKKGIAINQIKKAFKLAKESKLRTLAHFILGLSGEDIESQDKLINFCLSLKPDFVSFNIAAPVWNTTFREEVVSNNWLIDDGTEVDSSCSYPIWETNKLKRLEVWQMRRMALERFYLRPTYVFKQLKNIRTYYQLRRLAIEGLHLISILNKRQ